MLGAARLRAPGACPRGLSSWPVLVAGREARLSSPRRASWAFRGWVVAGRRHLRVGAVAVVRCSQGTEVRGF